MMEFSIHGVRLVAKSNAREHFHTTARRTKRQRATVKLAARAILGHPLPFPLRVTITRVSPGTVPMDSDNLAGACKAVRDGVADWLGVDDGNAEREGLVQWCVAQRRGPWGCEVRVEAIS